MHVRTAIPLLSLLVTVIASAGDQNDAVVLRAASQHGKDHIYSQICRVFGEKVKEYYDGPVTIELSYADQGSLGIERDFAALLFRSKLDYAVIAPSHLTDFSKKITFLDTPFLFRDYQHWEKTLASHILAPIADECEQHNMMVVGFAGGGIRNIFSNKPLRNLADLKGKWIRVMGAPVQSRTFAAIGMKPRPIRYSELYASLKAGIVEVAENEAAGISGSRFYEVAPQVTVTRHAYTVRPIFFNKKRFDSLPPALQRAIVRAGKEAAKFGRDTESSTDQRLLRDLADKKLITLNPFEDMDQVRSLIAPVKRSFAKELGLEELLNSIDQIR